MKLLHTHAVAAICKRQLGSLLGNPLGYVFILAFVIVAGGFLFLPDAFYARNIADFGPLLDIMPWLLVVLLPALSMGSWASERELGTEEQMLSLPMNVSDALLGKWLGIVIYFILALICSLANVVVLLWLGQPDMGLLLANYVGWVFVGMVLAALSVFASSLVGLPAVAFVLGVFFSASTYLLIQYSHWLEPFSRGVIPAGSPFTALLLSLAPLGLATFFLSLSRWQPEKKAYFRQVGLISTCLMLTLFNALVWLDRAAVDVDVTEEQLSSLSPASMGVLKEIKEPVTLAAFISKELPPELALKSKEVETLFSALEREMGSKLELRLYHPSDALDEAGSLASQHYGLQPRKVLVETLTGTDEAEVFLSAVVICGTRTQKIEHFDPGLSVEYEIVRALRSVSHSDKKVLGILSTDLHITGGYDFARGQMREQWDIVDEWRKQYEIRDVNADVAVDKDIDVLIVPQPSSLTDEQLVNLHDAIWQGTPTLILEDPMPMFSGPELGSSRPRTPPQQNPFAPPPKDDRPPKGDISKIFSALGLDYNGASIAWSGFNPSHRFRKIWPADLVWAFRSQKSFEQAPSTTGIDSVLFPWPGAFSAKTGRNEKITLQPLVQLTPEAAWGHTLWSDHFRQTFMGMQQTQPRNYSRDFGKTSPWIAVEVGGTMKRAYPFTKPKDDTTENGDSKKDENKNESEGLGVESGNAIHVIAVADTDFSHNQFFAFYRNQNDAFSKDDLKVLTDLRNVQFLANAVDALVGDQEFLELRTRRQQSRPLRVLENTFVGTQLKLQEATEKAEKNAQEKIQILQNDFQKRLSDIQQRNDLDENSKKQLLAQVQQSAQRQLNTNIESVNQDLGQQVRTAKIEQRRAIRDARTHVRVLAMGTPSLFLFIIILAVYFKKRRREQTDTPSNRQRRQA